MVLQTIAIHIIDSIIIYNMIIFFIYFINYFIKEK